MYSIQPYNDQILVRLKQLGSPSDLIIPDASTNDLSRPYFEVLAVGHKVSEHIKVGDKLLANAGHAQGFREPEGELGLLPEGCVWGKYVENVELPS